VALSADKNSYLESIKSNKPVLVPACTSLYSNSDSSYSLKKKQNYCTSFCSSSRTVTGIRELDL